MTRINAAIQPHELCDSHLLAEYREITRTTTLAYNWLNKGKKCELPDTFRLNTGHVKFFYNKIKYVHLRFLSLKKELIKRNFEANIEDDRFEALKNTEIYNDWQETKEARQILYERLFERLKTMKKIKYNKLEISLNEYKKDILIL